MKKYLIYQINIQSPELHGDLPFYDICIDSVSKYCEFYGIDHIVQEECLLGWHPYFEKLNALPYLDRYDKVLILDADVFITRLAPNIFDEDTGNFSAVIERELPLTPVYFDKIRRYSDKIYRSLDGDWKWDENGAEFFNAGVMVLSGIEEDPRGFLDRFKHIKADGQDQTLFNLWVKTSNLDFKHLDWRWNVLYGAVEDISQAYFVHFFLYYAMPEKGNEIAEIIREIVEFHK